MICTCPTTNDAHDPGCALIKWVKDPAAWEANLRLRERDFWERALLACIANCVKNADEIADKAAAAWRARWAKEGE